MSNILTILIKKSKKKCCCCAFEKGEMMENFMKNKDDDKHFLHTFTRQYFVFLLKIKISGGQTLCHGTDLDDKCF